MHEEGQKSEEIYRGRLLTNNCLSDVSESLAPLPGLHLNNADQRRIRALHTCQLSKN